LKIITNNSDLMDDIHALVGCEYLSDLKCELWREKVLCSICSIPQTAYSLTQWAYLFSYLFNEDIHFDTEAEIHDYLQHCAC